MALIDFSNIKGDLYGGVTAGVVALPLALAFGVASGMGAIAGLYGAIAIGIVAAIFGGTPTQISGPTGPMTVVAATLIAGEVQKAGSLEAAIPIIILTFFAAGIFQLLFGVLKLGKYISYVPNPVVSGFMSGIGVIIVILQIKDFFGSEISYGVTDSLLNLVVTVQNANWVSVALALATMAIIYLFPRLTKAVPSTLVALVGVTAFAWILKIEVAIIGDIPTGLPKLKLEAFAGLNLELLGYIIVPAMTLAALGMIDSLLTSVVADKMTKTRHRSNKELVGQGLGNMMAALIGGIPGAGATVRTVVNINSGGTTRISGVAHGLLLLIVLLVGAPVASHIPLSVLAGILITVGTHPAGPSTSPTDRIPRRATRVGFRTRWWGHRFRSDHRHESHPR